MYCDVVKNRKRVRTCTLYNNFCVDVLRLLGTHIIFNFYLRNNYITFKNLCTINVLSPRTPSVESNTLHGITIDDRILFSYHSL